nr:hypothetical protein BaRGS_020448 [Batillaria attramentaria]
MSSPKVEVLLKNVCSQIGEGPHWDDASQSLYFVDIQKGDVYRWFSATGDLSKVHLDGTVSLVVPRRAGGYVIGQGLGLSLLEWDTATATTIAEVDEIPTNRFNDGKCDASGRLWAGTMGKLDGEPVGSLYSLDTQRRIQKHLSGIGVSNGLAWSEDNRTMFYIDTDTHKISAYDFDLANGVMSNQRTAVDCPDLRPDGMTIDADGKLWVAGFGAAAVFRFDPETGQTLQKIDIDGAKQTTSVCWGGKNRDELYLTSDSFRRILL